MTVVDWGEASRACADGDSSGDLCMVRPHRNGLLIAVMDALGHGPDAASTAATARGVLESDAGASLFRLLQCCHERLRGTRGVALSMAYLDQPAATLTWIGVGNVVGLLVRGDTPGARHDSSLLLRKGVVGRNLPRLSAETLPVAGGDRLIFATDGIASDFADDALGSGSPERHARRILDHHYRGDDDALVIVAALREIGS